ncbi:proline-rich transmembrane protein 4-like [Actinia tenebrosa]|uniref:Proline-rich transmembrane protein 4-like n=1 Tax=Actinia tenebrosa TaxID=6105 RepID=A0A6P8HZM6_ACTTE|nr:proline-rich transmembrane protein 4-like [Actinia tenebrosa]XP_031561831.1 proline-rich transmembrane protein 4-like [Actinia tenebrosa]
MVERRKAVLNIFFVLTAGIFFYTLVNSREIRTQAKGKQFEEENIAVDKRTNGLKFDDLNPVAKTKEMENLIKQKRFHMKKDCNHPQKQEQRDKMGDFEFSDGKLDALVRGKIRKPRAEPETSPSSEPETSPSSEPETSPSSEPETSPSSEPEVKPESKAESETNPESTSEPEPLLWAEPEPDWDTAVDVWKTAWPLHVYGLASIFVLFGIISLIELIRIHVKSTRKTALKVSLLIIMTIFCVTRAVTLFTDPYGSKGIINPILSRILFAIGHPCIISAMSLLLLVLIDTTKMNIAPPTFQRVQFIIAVVFFHIVLVLITDVLVTFYVETKVLILICQIYYLLLGFVLTIGYARVGFKIASNSSASVTRDEKMEKLKILIGLASVTGFALVCATIYGAAGVFGIYSNVKVVDPWPWWAFQTVLRVLEIVMVVVLLAMNVKVTGSGLGIREMFGRCHRKLFQNKVEDTVSGPPINNTNSWMTNSVNMNT